MITDFYKQENAFMDQHMENARKIAKPEWTEPGTATEDVIGRENWTLPSRQYTGEFKYTSRAF